MTALLSVNTENLQESKADINNTLTTRNDDTDEAEGPKEKEVITSGKLEKISSPNKIKLWSDIKNKTRATNKKPMVN